MSDELKMILICVAVLVVIGIVIYVYYKFNTPTDDDNNKALDFINGYKEIFSNIIQEVIDGTDLSQYKSIMEYEFDIFTEAYKECWEYIEQVLDEALSNSAIGRLVAKCITRENVEMVVELLFTTLFSSTIENTYSAKWEESAVEAIEEDIRLQHEADLYETETKEVPEYVETKEEIDTSYLNPQVDEEEPYDPNDAGMELMDDIEGQMEMAFDEDGNVDISDDED